MYFVNTNHICNNDKSCFIFQIRSGDEERKNNKIRLNESHFFVFNDRHSYLSQSFSQRITNTDTLWETALLLSHL